MPWPWKKDKQPIVITEFTQMLREGHYFKTKRVQTLVNGMRAEGGISRFFDQWKRIPSEQAAAEQVEVLTFLSPEAMAEEFEVLTALSSNSEAVEKHALELAAKAYKSLLNDEGTALRADIKENLGKNYEIFRALPPGNNSDLLIAQRLTQSFLASYAASMTDYHSKVVLPDKMRKLAQDPVADARFARYFGHKATKEIPLEAPDRATKLARARKDWFLQQEKTIEQTEFWIPISSPLNDLIQSDNFTKKLEAEVAGTSVITKTNPSVKIAGILERLNQGLEDYNKDLHWQADYIAKQYEDKAPTQRQYEEVNALSNIQARVASVLDELQPLIVEINQLKDDKDWQEKIDPLMEELGEKLRPVMNSVEEILPFAQGFKGILERCHHECCKLIGHKTLRIRMQEEVAATFKSLKTKSMADMLNAPKKLKVEKMKVITEFNHIIRDQNPNNYLSSEAANNALDNTGVSRLFDAWQCSPDAAAEAYKALATLGSEAEVTQHAVQLAAAVYKGMLKEDGKTLRDDVKKALGSKYAQFRGPSKKMDDRVIAERLTQAFMVSYSQAITMHVVKNVLPAKMAKLKEDPDVQARLERYMRSQEERIPQGTPNREDTLAKKQQAWFYMVGVRIDAQEKGTILNSLQRMVSDQNELMAKMKAEIEGTQQKSTANNPVLKLTVMLGCLNSQLDAYLEDLDLQIKYCKDNSEHVKLTELRQKVWGLRANLSYMKGAIAELCTEKNWQSGLADQRGKFESLMAEVNVIAKDAKSFKGDFDFCYYHCCKLMGHETPEMLKIEQELAAGLQENPVSKAKDSLHHIMEEGHAKAVAGEGVEQGVMQEAGGEQLGM